MKISIPVLIWLSSALCFAQESLPVPTPAAQVVQATDLSPTLAGLRIPAAWISEEASQTFQHTAPVNRVVLGTHSRGTAVCEGTVQCELQEHTGGAEFVCHITGTIRSNTCGENGPALISSTANTFYTAVKRIVFDGRQLTTHPAVLCATTQIHITGIGSTSPGLRGRVVRRVASRRAADSLPEAEAITRQLTIQELQQHIDSEFSQRLTSLNRKLDSRLGILDSFSQGEYALSIRSQREFIEILLTRLPTTQEMGARPNHTASELLQSKNGSQSLDRSANQVAPLPLPPESLPDLPLVDNVVLWIPMPAVDVNELAPTDWRLSNVLQYMPAWLSAPLAQVKAKVGTRTSHLELLRHENWIGIQLEQTTARQ